MQFYDWVSYSNLFAAATISMLIFQAIVLNNSIRDTVDSTTSYIFAAADAYHIILFTLRIHSSQADSAGASLWNGYSCLLAGKWLIYFIHAEEFSEDNRALENLSFQIISVVYILLMWRATKPLIGSMTAITSETMMHYDMLWSVFVDLVDISLVCYAHTITMQESSARPRLVVLMFPEKFVVYKQAISLFAFLGLVCHGQSFPCAEWQHPLMSYEEYKFRAEKQRDASRDKNFKKESCEKKYRDFVSSLDVTFARERSALVSVFLINLPFFILRASLLLVAGLIGIPLGFSYMHCLKNAVYCVYQYSQLKITRRRKVELLSRMGEFCHEDLAKRQNSGVMVDTAWFMCVGYVIASVIVWQADITIPFKWGFKETDMPYFKEKSLGAYLMGYLQWIQIFL